MRDGGRRSIRLKSYDYALPGAYFITICVQDRACLFGSISDGTCHLSEAGEMVARRWAALAERFPGVATDPFVVMPNHFHGLISIIAPHPDDLPSTWEHASISKMVQWFKTGTTYDYIEGVKAHAWPRFNRRLWQRNYWETIVAHERHLNQVVGYIEANPHLWPEDTLHPEAEWPPKARPNRG